MAIQQRSQLKGFGQSTNEKYIVEDIREIISSVSSGFGSGTNYVIINANGNAIENGAALEQAYASAITYTPSGSALGLNNQFYIVLAPGYYRLSTNLAVNTPWINIISLTGLRDVFILGSFTLNVTTSNTYIQGIDTGILPFTTSGTSSAQIFENCRGGAGSFGSGTGAYGTYINCDASGDSFGANSVAGGIFTNCTAKWNSFGGGFGGGQASGVFKNCTASSESFGGFNGSASGTFEYCVGGNNSFGTGISGNASGIFAFCKLTAGSFPVPSGSGKFIYCHANGFPYNAGFIPQNNL